MQSAELLVNWISFTIILDLCYNIGWISNVPLFVKTLLLLKAIDKLIRQSSLQDLIYSICFAYPLCFVLIGKLLIIS